MCMCACVCVCVYECVCVCVCVYMYVCLLDVYLHGVLHEFSPIFFISKTSECSLSYWSLVTFETESLIRSLGVTLIEIHKQQVHGQYN